MPDLTRLNAKELAHVLTTHWKPYTPEMIEMDCEACAPRNADGSFDFVRYACWLLHEAERRDCD